MVPTLIIISLKFLLFFLFFNLIKWWVKNFTNVKLESGPTHSGGWGGGSGVGFSESVMGLNWWASLVDWSCRRIPQINRILHIMTVKLLLIHRYMHVLHPSTSSKYMGVTFSIRKPKQTIWLYRWKHHIHVLMPWYR